MNKRILTILDDVRKLEHDERVRSLHLIATTPDADEADGRPEEIEKPWAKEIERRITAGEIETVPVEEVMQRIRARRRML